jgi:hypothetical protein
MKRTGRVIYVAKTGGIKLEEEPDTWLNPTAKCKPFVKSELQGKNVELDMTEGGDQFTFIKVIAEPDTRVPTQAENLGTTTPRGLGTTTQAGQKAMDLQLNKESLIIRQTVIKAVAELVKVEPELQEEDQFFAMCKRLEKYIITGE